MLLCSLLLSSPLVAQYNKQQSADAAIVFNKLQQLDGLDTQVVLPKYQIDYENAENDLARLKAIYTIITLVPSAHPKQRVYYQELKRLAQALQLKEYEQVAILHLALHQAHSTNGDPAATLASWRQKMPNRLTDRVHAHYLRQLSRIDKSQSTIQLINQYYLSLELANTLPQERFMLLDSARRYDQVLEQKRARTKRVFEYALKYQYPINRLTYLYNQIILLIDNAEYTMAKQHADYYLQLATKLNDQTELFFANQITGYVLIFQQDFDSALAYLNNAQKYEKGLPIRWQMQNKRFTARALLLQGQLQQAKDNHLLDQTYLASNPKLDLRERHFHNINQSYITLLENNTLEGMAMIEQIFYLAYAEVISERNNNISKIRELASKELQARVRANTNSNYLLITLVILALLFISICFSLVRQIKLRKELQISRDVAVKMGRTDGLTKLNNRQYFQECLEVEFNRLKRYHHASASLLILDLDKFKSINDSYGHLAGDQVLKKVADLIKKRIRRPDVCGRLGGEEFAILLPETSTKGAIAFAKDLRSALANTKIKHEQNLINCTASIGLASFDHNLTSTNQWVDQADKALYRAKTQGRDQVVTFSG